MKLEEAAYAARLTEYLDLEVASMRRMIAAGQLGIGQLTAASGGIFRYRGVLRSRLLEIVMRVRNFGASQVADEMARQQSKT
jgi:hypothetical protein